MSNFSLEYPWVLLLLVFFVLCAVWCKERSEAIYFPHHELLGENGMLRRRLMDLLKWVGIVMVVISLSSPVLRENIVPSKQKGRDIVLVLDSSDSMRQHGFDPKDVMKRKFDVVKEVVRDFIDRRKEDRIGVITFADIAYIASPLTFEKKFLHDVMQMQRLGVAGKRTAINDALVQAYRLLKRSETKSKVIILLTDGVDNMSAVSFDDVVALIKQYRDVKLYIIGIGSRGDYNAPYLESLTQAGQGVLFEARNGHDLAQIYAKIDQLEKSTIKAKKVVRYSYLYIYPLMAAVLVLLGYLFVRSRV